MKKFSQMNSKKAKKFYLSRTENYYYEESVNESEDDCSTIFRLIHQTALNRSLKADIRERVQNVFDQQQSFYSSDDSLFSASHSSSAHLNTSSFNRKKLDLVQNQVNYVRPLEFHKRRQSDILPNERYEKIMDGSPFDSPLEARESAVVQRRRATVLPGFKPHFMNQSTQTSYNTESKISEEPMYDIDEEKFESIYRHSESSNIEKVIHQSVNAQISNRSTGERHSISGSLSKSQPIAETTNRSRNLSSLSKTGHKSIDMTKASQIETKNEFNSALKNQSNRKILNLTGKNSIGNETTQNKSKLKDVSNVSDRRSNFNSKYDSKYNDRTTKRRKSKYYDKTDYISFSKAHIYEPDEQVSVVNHMQTEIIESLLDSSTFKDLKLDSLISKRSSVNSTKFSKQEGSTKHYTGSFADPTRSMHKSLKSSGLVMNIEKSAKKIENKQAKSILIPEISLKSNQNEMQISGPKNSIQKLDEEEMNCNIDDKNDFSDVSLILNSTCSQENPSEQMKMSSEKAFNDNLDLDISVIGFDTSASDVDVVFDESINELNSFCKFNEEIEQVRRSNSHHSSPQISLGRTSISETLSQPESMKNSLDKHVEQAKKSEYEDISIEFNSDDEDYKEMPVSKKVNAIEMKSPETRKSSSIQASINLVANQQSDSVKCTPKSILKNSSKRIWDASQISLVDLTISPSMKSLSSRKMNSVRFSDKVSEKMTSNLSLKRDNKEIQSNSNLSDRLIGRSISKSISKLIDEVIDVNKSDKNQKTEDNLEDSINKSVNKLNENLPDLDVSFDLAEKSASLRRSIYEESEEESLNVTIDELSMSLENISENEDDEEDDADDDEDNDENDRTPLNTPEARQQSTFTVKSLKKPSKKVSKNVEAIRKQLPKYYETFVEKTPTIIYPNFDEKSSETGVRRSNRIRVRPLDFWRNCKPKYKLDSETKCQTIDGIEKGFSVDNPFKKKRTLTKRPKKSNKTNNKKKSKKRTYQSDEEEEVVVKKVRYCAQNEELSIHQQLDQTAIELSEKIKREATEYCSQKELNWLESKQSKGVHIAFMNKQKDKQGNTQASGFMKLESLLQKPPQRSANYVTNYVVMFGAAKVKISEKPDEKLESRAPVILRSMEAFTVKPNTLFSIENLRRDELLLYFYVSKV